MRPRAPSGAGLASGKDRYVIEAVMRAIDLMEAFKSEGELLSFRDLLVRTGLHRATTHRLLCTFEKRGLLDRAGNHRYRLNLKPLRPRKWRLGYAALGTEFVLTRELTEGIVRTAEQEQIGLVVLNNRNSSKIALANADVLVKEKVDLVIEYQPDEHAAPIIASKFLGAGIPFIAVNFPHPGATYYGANNYVAGLLAGRYLGRWARKHWQSDVSEVILVGRSGGGPFLNSRLSGCLNGIKEVLGGFEDAKVIYLDSHDGRFGPTLEAVRKHLRRSRAERTLVGTISDPTALGVVRAFEEAGRALQCAVVGQSASLEARTELRRPGTRLIGCVAYFPERYGEDLISLALKILTRQPVPPAILIKHQLITPENVNHYYPNDALIGSADIEALLLKSH